MHVSTDVGVQIEIDFQKTDYAVSESYGSVAPIIVVEGNVSAPFDVMITARNGTASGKSLTVLAMHVAIIKE